MKAVRLLLVAASAALVSALPGKRDQAKTLVSPAQYNLFYKYGEYAAAAIPNNCSVPPYSSVAVAYLSSSTTDTQATLFRNDADQEFILSYRGSTSFLDFLTDLNYFAVPYVPANGLICTNCTAHGGFYGAWQSIRDQSQVAIISALESHPTYEVVITGHSLGGALSYLAYADLKPVSEYKIRIGYSFGQPRVGNPAMADYFETISGASQLVEGNFFRVTHADDGVPQGPGEDMGFMHSRTEFWEANGPDGKPAANVTYRCYGQEPADCNDGQHGMGINGAHLSYAGISYSNECTLNQR